MPGSGWSSPEAPGCRAQVVPSLAIHDTMRYVGSDVSTLAFGGAMGMMGFLLAVGAKVGPSGMQDLGSGVSMRTRPARRCDAASVLAARSEQSLTPSSMAQCGIPAGLRCQACCVCGMMRSSLDPGPTSPRAQGKRYAMPNTTIMMHHPSGSARGQASDIHNEARELMRVRNYVNGVLSNITDKPISEVRSQPSSPAQTHSLILLQVQAGVVSLSVLAAQLVLKGRSGCPCSAAACVMIAAKGLRACCADPVRLQPQQVL